MERCPGRCYALLVHCPGHMAIVKTPTYWLNRRRDPRDAVAGGAGLRLGWTLIDPGDRTRRAALADEGRRTLAIVAGLVVVFLAAGTIEGFVTGSSLPTWARVGIGVVGEAALLTWLIDRGRAAAAKGLTGALGEI